jgi:acetylornithine/N-succinyldiaminopimelate aminotransferase
VNSAEIKERDKKYILGNYARNDLCITKGSIATCWTPEGKKFIDFSSGIGVNSLGYSDNGWVDAVTAQLKKVQHTSNLFYTEPCGELAEMLISRTGFEKAFFCNSGAEANEGAIKAARKYSFMKYGKGRYEIVTLMDSFHGRTMATITATGQDHYHKYFDPFVEGFVYAKPNDSEDLNAKLSEKTCAIMIELVQGEGGVNTLSKEYVKAIEKTCKERDLLLIADEVQTGIGRTGKLFAYEHYGIKPDLVTMAKGLGAGLPVGGILFEKSCAPVFEPGDHGTTFGGNPAVCAGGVEVMKRIDERFLEQVAEKGRMMKERIGKIDGVTGVSGLGMMMGISLKDKKAGDVVKSALELGLIILTAKDRLRLLPPLNITNDELDEGLELLEKAINDQKNEEEQ